MLNPSAYALGANRSCIRDLFEYGCQRAAVVGRENVYDYSLGNPSIPSPKEVDETVRQILDDTDSLLIHGYTSAVGHPQGHFRRPERPLRRVHRSGGILHRLRRGAGVGERVPGAGSPGGGNSGGRTLFSGIQTLRAGGGAGIQGRPGGHPLLPDQPDRHGADGHAQHAGGHPQLPQ